LTQSQSNHPSLKFSCSEDFNKRGGALGNIYCEISGRIKDKPIVLPEIIVTPPETDDKLPLYEEAQEETCEESVNEPYEGFLCI
jgi:hypothetical protein